MKTQFTVRGRQIVATAEQVEAALCDVDPDTLHVHCVEIGGRIFPVRQAMAEAFDLERTECHPHSGNRVFRQLGFNLHTRSRRPQRKLTRAELRAALPHRSPEIGPAEDQWLELPMVHLGWSHWERWRDILDYGLAVLEIPPETPGVYEVGLSSEEERLTIGRAADLRARILSGLIKGTAPHTSGAQIRQHEDLHKVVVRWAATDRPAAVEEELHRRHIAEYGRLPKYTQRT